MEMEIDGDEKVECMGKFCYIGYMIGAGGGVYEASQSRVWFARA